MKQLAGIISVLLILLVVIISVSTFSANVNFSFFAYRLNLPVGSLTSLISAFSFLSALSLLVALGLADGEQMSEVQKKNKLEEDKLRREVESDRVQYLENKIKTLEAALKKINKSDL